MRASAGLLFPWSSPAPQIRQSLRPGRLGRRTASLPIRQPLHTADALQGARFFCAKRARRTEITDGGDGNARLLRSRLRHQSHQGQEGGRSSAMAARAMPTRLTCARVQARRTSPSLSARGPPRAPRPRAKGLKVNGASREAAAWCDLMMFTMPDELQAEYLQESTSATTSRPALGHRAFAHGLNVHFGLIEASKDVDVIMMAPKGPGHTVRGEYVKGGGVALPRRGRQRRVGPRPGNRSQLTARPSAAGARVSSRRISRKNARQTLFGEQAVLCGGLVELIRCGFRKHWSRRAMPRRWPISSVSTEGEADVDLIYEGGIGTELISQGRAST